MNASDEIVEVVLRPRELEALRFGYRESVTDTHLKHVRELPFELPEIFAAAANRAREAGFDGVELHYAHAYTMAGFLSAQNDRNDGYGGTQRIAFACRSRFIARCAIVWETITWLACGFWLMR